MFLAETASANKNGQKQTTAKLMEKTKSHEKSVLSETFLNELDNTLSLQSDTSSGKSSADNMPSETAVIVLDNTLLDQNDTLNSTVCDANFDNTYDLDLDTSVTVLKSVAQANDKTEEDKTNKNTCIAKHSAKVDETAEKQTHTDSGIKCTDDFTIKADTPFICCNICMEWYHPQCVGIKLLMKLEHGSVLVVGCYQNCSLSKITNDNSFRQHPENGHLHK